MHFPTAIAVLATAASAAALPTNNQTPNPSSLARRAVAGKSTFYGGNVQGGTCSFSTYKLPAGLYGTAFSGQVWDSAANCGGCVKVSHGGKSIVAMVRKQSKQNRNQNQCEESTTNTLPQIVDKCPECDAGHLDLFENAWSALESDKGKGIIDTSYEFVDCGSAVTGPLTIHLKTGVSQYWFSAQVVNANRRTAKLEVSTDGKTWKEAKRTDYNFFEIPSGVGAAKASVRVTSGDGKVVVVKDVAMTPDLSVQGPGNY
jgi:hypothetical protein